MKKGKLNIQNLKVTSFIIAHDELDSLKGKSRIASRGGAGCTFFKTNCC